MTGHIYSGGPLPPGDDLIPLASSLADMAAAGLVLLVVLVFAISLITLAFSYVRSHL